MESRRLHISEPDGSASYVAGIDDTDNSNVLTNRLLSFGRPEPTPLDAYPKLFRCSSLGYACPRGRALGTLCSDRIEIRTRGFGIQTEATFDWGRTAHWMLQNDSKYFGNNRVGWWLCLACGRITHFGKPIAQSCPLCNANRQAVVYHEHSLRLEDPFYLSGHLDMFLELAPGVVRIVDFKTISQKEFPGLAFPKGEHVEQILGYCLGVDNNCNNQDPKLPIHIDTSISYIMYISKGHVSRGMPYKTFKVDRKQNAAIEQSVVSVFRGYTAAVRGGPLPEPNSECVESGWDVAPAKYCMTRQLCMAAHQRGG